MQNSYKGYWFSCQTVFSKDIKNLAQPRRWILLLESKSNNKTHSVGLNNQMTMGQVLDLAYTEIDKLVAEDIKQA
jgi:hypothetical protein